jgi:hypothetical protein
MFTGHDTPFYVIDPNEISLRGRKDDTITFIKKKATEGVKELYDILMKQD